MTRAARKATPAQEWAGVASYMREEALQEKVEAYCDWLHLLHFHDRRPEGSNKGFPDLVIVGPGGTLFRELKSETGTLTPEQALWRDALVDSGENWDVWRPSDWPKIESALRRLVVRRPLGDIP